MARALETEWVWGVGDVAGSDLRGLITWAEYEEDRRLWEVVIVATDIRWRRQGIARGLKDHLLDLAKSKRILSVVSRVHRDNQAMINLNEEFGAFTKVDPDDIHGELFFCAIDPQASRPDPPPIAGVSGTS